jgi:hypothetical protein
MMIEKVRSGADDGERDRFAWLHQPVEQQCRRDIGIGRIYVATLVLVALAVLASAAGRLHGSTMRQESGIEASKGDGAGAAQRKAITGKRPERPR